MNCALVAQLVEHWAAMQDCHEFDYSQTIIQGLKITEEEFSAAFIITSAKLIVRLSSLLGFLLKINY